MPLTLRAKRPQISASKQNSQTKKRPEKSTGRFYFNISTLNYFNICQFQSLFCHPAALISITMRKIAGKARAEKTHKREKSIIP